MRDQSGPGGFDTHNERALAALLRFIERERDETCEAILSEARQQARNVIREALRQARARVSEVIDERRRDRDTRVQAAHAAEEGHLRRRQHELLRELLDDASGLLESRLRERWAHARHRAAWIGMSFGLATVHLPDGTWTIEHPGEFDRDEAGGPAAELEKARPDVRLRWRQADLDAGLRIRTGTARLDTSAEALLTRRAEVEGLLLGRMAAVADPRIRHLLQGLDR